MDILMIGNGFDLAHGLPTRYIDFLEWVKKYQQFYSYAKSSRTARYREEKEPILRYFNNIFYKESNRDRCNEIYNLVNENTWIDYFMENPIYQKENWIDFESEISKVIQSLEKDMLCAGGEMLDLENDIVELSNSFLRNVYSKYTFAVQSADKFLNGKCESITFKEIRDRLYLDLNKLTRALEIYLTDYVEQLECKLISPEIKDISIQMIKDTEGAINGEAIISKVLCFNYTNTYERIYAKEDIDYIHGKADITNTIESNNMVLGIDEYLPDERKDKEINFIAFKKFYQRILKETGCKYKEWIEKIREEYENFIQKVDGAKEVRYKNVSLDIENIINRMAASAIKSEKCRKHNLYIWGHSLDITDGDILRDLILNDNVYTTIFYLNKDVMGQQIANLVKVIGQDELIRRTGASTKTIEFKQQKKLVSINK